VFSFLEHPYGYELMKALLRMAFKDFEGAPNVKSPVDTSAPKRHADNSALCL
jgi:hypothetical protein